MSNRLIEEKSPYLLQHAENPVNWYPWGSEAFEKALKEDKPIFLSIGYSTCHWCHVMEHESFEDEEVAELMNRAFVSIKVDREERPDIDNVYMTVCQILSQGACGWPLNILMTPDKKPFFAATYIPKENRFGRLGMVDMIPKVEDVWKNKKEEILNSAQSITDALHKAGESGSASGVINYEKILNSAYDQLLSRFDNNNGGFGNSPKFPSPHQLLFLVRYHARTGSKAALNMVEKTLNAMGKGGIFDHIGFGFHRYSTDAEWLVPHFEKMLYDQALLSMAYTEAYQLTGKKTFRRKAEQILEYVLRDMTSPGGGFYSAEDADSEGVEGKFYVWTTDEVKTLLGAEDAKIVIDVFNLADEGNFHEEATGDKTGANILHLRRNFEEISKDGGIPPDEMEERLESARKKLFNEREKRVHPYKDDKILTDWNGLMIVALSKAARVFENERFADAAEKAVEFIKCNLQNGEKLLHRYRQGDSAITGSIDDYAFFIWGLIECYESTFNQSYLNYAIELNNTLITHFADDDNGGFYFTPDYGEELITRQKEIYDGAIPSGNSVCTLNLLKLSRITGDTQLEQLANRTAGAFTEIISRSPVSFTMHMNSMDFGCGPAFEIVIAGDKNSGDTKKLLSALNSRYIPNKVVLLKSGDDGIEKIAGYVEEMDKVNGKATAYVCKNFVCELPVNDPSEMLEILQKKA